MVDVRTAAAAEMFRSHAPLNTGSRPFSYPETLAERCGTTGNLDLIQKPDQAW